MRTAPGARGATSASRPAKSRTWIGGNEGKCVVPFRVIYAEIQTEQYQVDWCKVPNIIVSDTDVTYN
jgi:hypothetical protein